MISPDLKLHKAIETYYLESHLPTDGGISDRWATYQIGPFLFRAFPNFSARAKAIPKHDLNHLVIAADASLLGESYVAAWELGSSIGQNYYLWWLHPQTLVWGLLYRPYRLFQYYLLGRESQNAYNVILLDKDTIASLREKCLPKNQSLFNMRHFFDFVIICVMGIILMVVSLPFFAAFHLFAILIGD
jgi:hypothetical protein